MTETGRFPLSRDLKWQPKVFFAFAALHDFQNSTSERHQWRETELLCGIQDAPVLFAITTQIWKAIEMIYSPQYKIFLFNFWFFSKLIASAHLLHLHSWQRQFCSSHGKVNWKQFILTKFLPHNSKLSHFWKKRDEQGAVNLGRRYWRDAILLSWQIAQNNFIIYAAREQPVSNLAIQKSYFPASYQSLLLPLLLAFQYSTLRYIWTQCGNEKGYLPATTYFILLFRRKPERKDSQWGYE